MRPSLDEIRAAAEEWRRRAMEAEAARSRLRLLMEAAIANGRVPAEVARAAGISRARLSQLRRRAGTGERPS